MEETRIEYKLPCGNMLAVTKQVYIDNKVNGFVLESWNDSGNFATVYRGRYTSNYVRVWLSPEALPTIVEALNVAMAQCTHGELSVNSAK